MKGLVVGPVAPHPSLKGRLSARWAALVCACVNAFLYSVRRILWPRRRPQTAKRVCIYRIGHVGDTICAIPAMYAVRRAYPDAHLTLLTSPVRHDLPSAEEILKGADWIDDLWVYYQDDIATLRKGFAFFRSMRRENFDVWVEFPQETATLKTLLRNMIAARFAGARWACGWRQNGAPFALQAQSQYLTFPTETERLLELLRDSGFETTGETEFPLPIGSKEEAVVDALLEEHSIDPSRLVAIAPSAKREPNRWPLQRYVEIGRYLVSRGFQVVVTAGASDRGLCESVVSGIGRNAFNCAGRTTLKESCEMLKRCQLLVCNDSGVQHMAGAVGTPCISLFSARDMPNKWYPHGSRNLVLRKWVDCHTCLTEKCPYDNLCMNMITVDEVIEAIDAKVSHWREPVQSTG